MALCPPLQNIIGISEQVKAVELQRSSLSDRIAKLKLFNDPVQISKHRDRHGATTVCVSGGPFSLNIDNLQSLRVQQICELLRSRQQKMLKSMGTMSFKSAAAKCKSTLKERQKLFDKNLIFISGKYEQV